MDISFIDRVQRSFTKRIPAIHNLPYSDRLLHLNMKSLQHRMLYCDLVLMYKIVHGFSVVKLNDLGISPLSNRHTRSYGTAWFNCPCANIKFKCIQSCLQDVQVMEYVTEKGFINVIISN